MPSQILSYREVLPILPEKTWHTSRELYDIFSKYYPQVSIGNFRTVLCIWTKRGFVHARPIIESQITYKSVPKLYCKAILFSEPIAAKPCVGQRSCLSCRKRFWPENRYNFMCRPCQDLDH